MRDKIKIEIYRAIAIGIIMHAARNRRLRRSAIDSFGGNTLVERSIVGFTAHRMTGVKYNAGVRETDKKVL